jgi:hypothetical protein
MNAVVVIVALQGVAVAFTASRCAKVTLFIPCQVQLERFAAILEVGWLFAQGLFSAALGLTGCAFLYTISRLRVACRSMHQFGAQEPRAA